MKMNIMNIMNTMTNIVEIVKMEKNENTRKNVIKKMPKNTRIDFTKINRTFLIKLLSKIFIFIIYKINNSLM